jgi:hypothetical protein
MDPWTAHMRRGDFAAAWDVCDAVLARRAGLSCVDRERHEQWIWDGTPLVGRRVLVRCYHGLGDTIQFARYAPLLSQIAAETTWWAPPELLPLLRSVQGMGYLLPLHDGAPGVEYDVDIESMELSHAFRSTLDSLPRTVPYVHVHPVTLRRTTRLAVGLVPRAGDWDPRRSIPHALLAPLAAVPDVRFYALHEPTIVGTARLMLALDLVITVDSMPAHLAGAVGVPVWTLLHHDADWRWMEGRATSPWYPTMRLFRQPSPGDWESVTAAVAGELRSWRHEVLAS